MICVWPALPSPPDYLRLTYNQSRKEEGEASEQMIWRVCCDCKEHCNKEKYTSISSPTFLPDQREGEDYESNPTLLSLQDLITMHPSSTNWEGEKKRNPKDAKGATHYQVVYVSCRKTSHIYAYVVSQTNGAALSPRKVTRNVSETRVKWNLDRHYTSIL